MPFPTARELEIRDEHYGYYNQVVPSVVRREIERKMRCPSLKSRGFEIDHRLPLLQIAAIGEELRSLGFMVHYGNCTISIAWSDSPKEEQS